MYNIYIHTHVLFTYIYIRIKHTFYIMKYNFIWNFMNKLCCIILPSAFFSSRSREKQLASPSTKQVRKLQLKLCFWQIGQCRCTERRCRYCNRIIYIYIYLYMEVSCNEGTPISSILIGFSIINHPFWGSPVFGNHHIYISRTWAGIASKSLVGK